MTVSSIKILTITLMLLGSASVLGAQERQDDSPPKRVRNVVLLPNEGCPKPATPDEIVVCGREDEPYRIPKRFRGADKLHPEQAWGARALALDEIGRQAGALPDTCSVVGPSGTSGCAQQRHHEWFLERQEMRREAAAVP